jgi:carbohydrate-binding DOMON domain-containing protein
LHYNRESYILFLKLKGYIMKKILMVAAIALCFAGNSFAEEKTGGQSATASTVGGVGTTTIVAGVAALGVVAAISSNNRGTAKVAPIDPPIQCGAGEELVNGECVTITSTVTSTNTVTSTVTATNTVTSTMTTPVTVTATTTL